MKRINVIMRDSWMRSVESAFMNMISPTGIGKTFYKLHISYLYDEERKFIWYVYSNIKTFKPTIDDMELWKTICDNQRIAKHNRNNFAKFWNPPV